MKKKRRIENRIIAVILCMGQMIYPDGEEQEYLTYSKSHNYVLSQKFNSDKPELVADQLTEKHNNFTRDTR